MKYYKGDKVFLVETHEVAVVTRADDQDLLYVEVDGMEIPVFSSDISSEIPEELVSEMETEGESSSENISTYDEQSDELGLFICLEPQTELDEVSEFNIYLVNSFNTELQFDFQFLNGETEVFSLEKNIQMQNSMLLYSIDYDELNENPSFALQVRRKDIDKKELTFIQKIKANNLFNKERELPFFEEPVYAYQLLEKWIDPVEEKKDFRAEELKALGQNVINRLKSEKALKKKNNPEPIAHEIDLHIEKLIQDCKGMSNGEIMQVQIKYFRQAFERAITSGLDRFYAIHGLGKGKLKEEIFLILREYPQVKSFRNEYHPRYGFGATEIFLK